MSPSMTMELSSRNNTSNNHPSLQLNRHHVRNLWPPVGGGLPGGKPIEPALGRSVPMLQKPTDHFSQSISYAQNKSIPKQTDEAIVINNNNNNSYYYESSQVRCYPMAASSNVIANPEELSHFYTQQPPKYFQHPAEGVTVNRWCPPSPMPQTQTSRFYHPDPTTLFNQVSFIGYAHHVRI